MKAPIACLLGLIALGNIASADVVLIYTGSHIGASGGNGASQGISEHIYTVFDSTSHSFNEISDTPKNKTFTVSNEGSFILEPVTLSSKISKTYFLQGSTNTSSFFIFSLFFVQGVNSPIKLSATSTVQYPKTLSGSTAEFAGQGAAANDSVNDYQNRFQLDLPLTQQSNTAISGGDNLAESTEIITSLLIKKGYSETP